MRRFNHAMAWLSWEALGRPKACCHAAALFVEYVISENANSSLSWSGKSRWLWLIMIGWTDEAQPLLGIGRIELALICREWSGRPKHELRCCHSWSCGTACDAAKLRASTWPTKG